MRIEHTPVHMEIVGNADIPLEIGGDNTTPLEVMPVMADRAYYDGEYDLIPTQTEQVLITGGKAMRRNIRIAPIPHNYGLITWNGSFLTIT